MRDEVWKFIGALKFDEQQGVSMQKIFISIASVVFVSAACYGTVNAIELADAIELHGYGSTGYLQTSDNQYLKADNKGTWDYYAAALLFTGTLNENTKFWAQGFTSSVGPDRTHLDWAFIDYKINSKVTLRAGQIKFPVGLYNEIRDIEFLQLSTLKPIMYQEASEISHEAFQGASIVIDHDFGEGSLSWDAYSGKTYEKHSSEIKFGELGGVRVTYYTPLDGLKFMLTGHLERVERVDTGDKSTEALTMVSVEYLNNILDLKSEYAEKTTLGIKSTSGYLQAGIPLGPQWTPYIRSDYITTDTLQSNNPARYQKTQTIGLGYKINKNLGLRAEVHFNQGYALPVASKEVVDGAGITYWNIFATSINFIF